MMETLETKFAVHEAVCAQRYEAIQQRLDDGSKRMTKIEYWLYALMIAVLFGPGAAAEFVKKLFGL